ncbi:hypothetical protein ACIBJE_18080 [Micromonospora sp. NPDC050187]|uniref:hypothetical protein n=1 Tax=Micromonospora sp. NPDC050187 TaxID=3364277 RepID=UPI00379E242F
MHVLLGPGGGDGLSRRKRDVRIPNTNLRRNIDTGAVSNPNSGCAVLAVLALSGLIPSVLLMWNVLI